MDIADKTRLAKLLGMLGSSFDGERANAARMIQAMSEKYKLTINEMVAMAHGGTPFPHRGPQPPPGGPSQPKHTQQGMFSNKALQALEMALRNYRHFLSPWEQQFADDVSNRYTRDYELSPKQLAVVERIMAKINRYESRNGGFGDI